jgi:glucoamylase
LIHYKHGSYISIFSDQTVCQFQLGNNAYESAKYGVLGGYDSIGMMPDGALLWELGSFKSRERKRIVLYICIASSLKEVKALTRSVKKYDIECHYYRTKKYWNSFLKNTRQISTGNSNVDRLYKRSLLVFKLMSDKETGGLLASPEIDENFTKSGRYAYCWGRDAAFITSALDKCGLKDLVYNFYCWAAKTQEDDGSWAQRYYIDGNLAPSWGMQIDETGTLIWGMFQHFLETGDKAFLKSMWYNIEKGVEFLVDFIDKDMGLPKPSYDLWEERFGVHTYSCVAVYAGIRSGADIAEILEISGGMAEKWGNAAERLRDTIVKEMWREDIGSFLRSKLTKLNPWGSEPGNNKIVIQVNPKGYQRDVTLVDERVDVSLLGVAVPFGVFDINDPRVESTVKMIESKLTVYSVGGMMRYEGDNYIGGNPWIVATLWIALYYVRKRDFERANHYLEWAVKGCTELELLPEQVDKESGEAAWVIPLTWSHAMFVLVLIELVEAGEM